MANQFINLPVVVNNGIGAVVDVSSFGALKSILVQGNADVTINVEINNDAAQGGSWQSVATFQGGGISTVSVAARWMRARASNFVAYKGGTTTCDVGGPDDGTLFDSLPVPTGNSTGAPVDVSALGVFKTVQVGGPFRGTLLVEVSENGTQWAQPFSFGAPGAQSATIAAQFMRVTRVGVPLNTPGLPVVNVGGCVIGGGGGITGILVEEGGVPIVGNPHSTVNFVGAGVTVVDAAGAATVTIPGGIDGVTVVGIAGNPHDTFNFVGPGLTVADVAGVATITVAGAASKNIVLANSPYTILPTDDDLFVDTAAGAITLILPDPSTFGYAKDYYITDSTGNVGINNITLQPHGAEKIQGLASNKTFQTAWGNWRISTNGIDWFVK